MRITVDNARSIAASLISAAATAQAASAPDFDILDALAEKDDDARRELAEAIQQADGS